ncbi:hypothetical protein PAPHI01_0028 [Pancytospora philotis]|nr:hypothetical protein PAPHI01_0028 [Pancytospora philotis]
MSQQPAVLAVMSGKGGVGKSSIAALVAETLAAQHRVLVLDFDICGPSIATALGTRGALVKTENGFSPVRVADNLDVLSFGLVLKPEDAVIWRGPKKQVFLELFYNSIDGYDYVVIDTPPGISEEHAFLLNKGIRALVVTTPQNVALSDTQRCIEFCLESGLAIAGLIENMACVRCERCSELQHPFGNKGGENLAKEYELPFWGQLEIEPAWSKSMDAGALTQNHAQLKAHGFLDAKLRQSGILK